MTETYQRKACPDAPTAWPSSPVAPARSVRAVTAKLAKRLTDRRLSAARKACSLSLASFWAKIGTAARQRAYAAVVNR